MQDFIAKAKQIRLMIFDVDGVLTNGRLWYGPKGIELKEFHVHDGQWIKFLQKTGVEIAIITAKQSDIVEKRMHDLGINYVYQGHSNKLVPYEDLKSKLHFSDEQIGYLGDDLPDLPIIRRVGLGMTVASAAKVMQEQAFFTTKAKGGKGAAREVCELIMRAQGTYQNIIDGFL